MTVVCYTPVFCRLSPLGLVRKQSHAAHTFRWTGPSCILISNRSSAITEVDW